MKIFLFLGNYGEKYKNTRHNVGFLFANYLKEKWGTSEFKLEKKFKGEVLETNKSGEKFFFLKPHTYMNKSGESLQLLKNFYKISDSDIYVFYDDKDLPLGKIRYREKGSAGGHNGVKDIIRVLGHNEFKRWKIGVDTDLRLKFESTADFVLANFLSDEKLQLEAEIFPDLRIQMEEKLD